MTDLLFAQAFALSCLISLVVGFVFWGGFVCGRMWNARKEEKTNQENEP